MGESPPDPYDLAPGEDQPADETSHESPRSRPQAPTPPIPLDYGKPQRSGLPQPAGATANSLSLGCLYAFVAAGVTFALLSDLGGRTLPGWWFVIPLMLLGVPFVLALSFRGWRAFAAGMLIFVGVALLAVGACTAYVFSGLGH